MNIWAYVLNSAGWTFAGYYAAVLNYRLWNLHRRLTRRNGNGHS